MASPQADDNYSLQPVEHDPFSSYLEESGKGLAAIPGGFVKQLSDNIGSYQDMYGQVTQNLGDSYVNQAAGAFNRYVTAPVLGIAQTIGENVDPGMVPETHPLTISPETHTLQAVDHDPWDPLRHELHPVDHDPWWVQKPFVYPEDGAPASAADTSSTLTLPNPYGNAPVYAGSQDTFSKSLDTHLSFYGDALSEHAKLTNSTIGNILRDRIGNMNVFTADANELNKYFGDKPASTDPNMFTAGIYDPVSNHIVLNSQILGDPQLLQHTLIHEGLHGAFYQALKDPQNLAIVDSLRQYTQDVLGPEAKDYGLTNHQEFVAEAFSNPKFQEKLINTPVSKELLDKVSGLAVKPNNMWEFFTSVVKKILGLKAQPNVLDATMRVMQYIDEKHGVNPSVAGVQRE